MSIWWVFMALKIVNSLLLFSENHAGYGVMYHAVGFNDYILGFWEVDFACFTFLVNQFFINKNVIYPDGEAVSSLSKGKFQMELILDFYKLAEQSIGLFMNCLSLLEVQFLPVAESWVYERTVKVFFKCFCKYKNGLLKIYLWLIAKSMSTQ